MFVHRETVSCSRVLKFCASHNVPGRSRSHLLMLFTLYRKKLPSLAARFAAKEAVVKALGKPAKAISLKEIEILSNPGGQPVVNLYGRMQQQAKKMGLGNLAITISHSKEYAVAFVSGDTK